jgi:integrase
VEGRRDIACLHTKDREEAERLGRLLLSELLKQELVHLPGKVTLGELWSRFQREAVSFLDNSDTTKKDAISRAAILIGFFGEDCDVSQLTERDQAAYVSQRLAGGIQCKSGRVTPAVRPRSVEADLVLLHNMLSWATTVRVDGGQRWLKENPLAGIRRIREQNPKRPIATWERFERTREAMRKLRMSSTAEENQIRWAKMEFALVLVEATGRRLGSVRQLRWEDIDLVRGTIRWRAESDKKRHESVVPIPVKLVDEIRQFQQLLSAVAGFVFAAPLKSNQPLDRHWFEKWLVVAEKEAELPKLDGGLWHPYRRKWATERKYLPLKDVAAAGGWRDTETLLKSYQQPDEETLLVVMNEERKVRDRVQGA